MSQTYLRFRAEIAQQIADQLQAKLSPAEKAAIAERPTADPVAYAFYTQAKAIGDVDDWEGGEKSLNRKVELLEKATQRDPNFALAYCALAKTQCDLFSVTGAGATDLSRTHLELAKKAAEAALRVRPDLGEAHLELARYYFYAGSPTLVISTGHVTSWLSLAASYRTILRRFSLRPESIAAKTAGTMRSPISKRQANSTHATVRSQSIAGETYQEMRRYKELEQLMTKDAASGTTTGPLDSALAS